MKYLTIFFLLAISACNNNSSQTSRSSNPAAENPELPAGFADFYQKFHSDSLYQMEHIVWPLEGLPNNADSAVVAAKNFHWMPEDWRMQHQFDFQVSEYKREIVPLTETIVMERILHQSGQFGMIRRFAIVGGDWNLIYYAGVNRLMQ
ncbi:MAG: hypothetical protein GC192_24405 [Bacteroidetes bacterium]|nr:hypothetical protein [Bacteroidota bacterium]